MSVIRALQAKPDYWGWVGDLYLAGNDDGVAMRLLDGQDYEPQSRKIWRELCAGAEVVVDVGAHTGIYSIDAWRAGAKHVLSVEPYSLNHARLVMNLRHAGFDTASCVMCAASDANGSADLAVGLKANNYYCYAGGQVGNAPAGAESAKVKVRRLDALLKPEWHAKVRAVKIDTEKHGCRVLAGMPGILSHRPDLILECIEHGMTEILAPLGYRFYKIIETGARAGLERVDALVPDATFSFDSPNRYATVKEV